MNTPTTNTTARFTFPTPILFGMNEVFADSALLRAFRAGTTTTEIKGGGKLYIAADATGNFEIRDEERVVFTGLHADAVKFLGSRY